MDDGDHFRGFAFGSGPMVKLDIGILVNALLFPAEFAEILGIAASTETPLNEVEQTVLGFSHCESGRFLAEIWKLPPHMGDVIVKQTRQVEPVQALSADSLAQMLADQSRS
jgi:HD-like signal output (HDOD) protein